MGDDDVDFIDPENYSGSNSGESYSHKALIMASMRKVLEAGANEMRAGYFNEKTDRKGNVVLMYMQDTRKLFIEAVETLEMFMECDLDEEAKDKIKEIRESLKEKEKEIVEQEANDWKNAPPLLLRQRMMKGIFFREGYLHPDLPYYQDLIEERIHHYRQIFKELNKLTKRLNFYEVEDLIL